METNLAWVTAIFSSIAAIGGVWAAIATGIGASATLAQVDLERRPVMVLTCKSAFTLQEQHDHISPPRAVLFLDPNDAAPRLLDLDPNIPTYTADGHIIELPPLYMRCSVRNSGRLAVVGVKIPISMTFFSDQLNLSSPSHMKSATVNVPSLSPGELFEFAVASGSPTRAAAKFGTRVSLTRIDLEKEVEVTLFMDQESASAEGFVYEGFTRRIAPAAHKK